MCFISVMHRHLSSSQGHREAVPCPTICPQLEHSLTHLEASPVQD